MADSSQNLRLKTAKPSGRIFILADDFTGACDTGICFRSPDNQVRISLDGNRPWSPDAGENVVQVFLSDTRKYGPDRAYQIAYDAAKKLDDFGGKIRLYQKIDSTMRGNVGREISAVLRARGLHTAVLCPAFPGTHRIVRDGKLLIGGKPISQTAYAHDPRNPIHVDRMADIVRLTNSEIDIVETKPENLAGTLRKLEEKPSEAVVVPDAETEQDLETIADALTAFPDVLAVGAAGLGKHLARQWLTGWRKGRLAERPAVDRLIVASGSANPRSLKQLSALEENVSFPLVRIDKRQLTRRENAAEEMLRVQRTLQSAVQRSKAVGIALSQERVNDTPYGGPFETYVGKMVSYCMDLIKEKSENVGILIAGADTAVTICRMLGIKTLMPQREVVTGIPYSISGQGFHLISKAGGFGDDDALLKGIQFFMPDLVPQKTREKITAGGY